MEEGDKEISGDCNFTVQIFQSFPSFFVVWVKTLILGVYTLLLLKHSDLISYRILTASVSEFA